MTDKIVLEYSESRDLLARAMTSWAQPKRTGKALIWYWSKFVIFGAVLGLALTWSGIFRITPDGFWIGLLAGFYATLIGCVVAHRMSVNKLSRFAFDLVDRAGPVTATFDQDGARFKSRISDGWQSWDCVDQVIEMKDATVLRAGAIVYPLPDEALPEGLTPQAFRDWLSARIEPRA